MFNGAVESWHRAKCHSRHAPCRAITPPCYCCYQIEPLETLSDNHLRRFGFSQGRLYIARIWTVEFYKKLPNHFWKPFWFKKWPLSYKKSTKSPGIRFLSRIFFIRLRHFRPKFLAHSKKISSKIFFEHFPVPLCIAIRFSRHLIFHHFTISIFQSFLQIQKFFFFLFGCVSLFFWIFFSVF